MWSYTYSLYYHLPLIWPWIPMLYYIEYSYYIQCNIWTWTQNFFYLTPNWSWATNLYNLLPMWLWIHNVCCLMLLIDLPFSSRHSIHFLKVLFSNIVTIISEAYVTLLLLRPGEPMGGAFVQGHLEVTDGCIFWFKILKRKELCPCLSLSPFPTD